MRNHKVILQVHVHQENYHQAWHDPVVKSEVLVSLPDDLGSVSNTHMVT